MERTGVLFLLSLGAVPIACFHDEGPALTEGASATGSTSEEGSTTDLGSTGKTSSSDGSASASASTTSTSGSTTTESSLSDTLTGTTITTTGPATTGPATTGGVDESCDAYAAHWLECDANAGDHGDACRNLLAYAGLHGDACLALHIATIACLSEAECAGLLDKSACVEMMSDAMMLCAASPIPACVVYGDKAAECNGNDEGAAEFCGYYVDYLTKGQGAVCGQAMVDLFACLSALDCPGFMMGVGCEAEQEALNACG